VVVDLDDLILWLGPHITPAEASQEELEEFLNEMGYDGLTEEWDDVLSETEGTGYRLVAE
jgi:hypothetical protein